jgi:5-methyltetrahydropteroyltriglutamate--homocysteine methyltransferase
MALEYEAIVDAGLLLQIDAPDLTTMFRLADLTFDEFAAMTERGVAAINRATKNIDPERVRVHVCWGADEAPHHRDVPLRDIVGMLLKLRPQGLAVPGANGRHSHEWSVWRDVGLPNDKVLIPGVIDSTTNIIEHPEAVAERIVRYAEVVGASQLIAGVDCGFGTVAGVYQVDERIVWAKLEALAEGARLASGVL